LASTLRHMIKIIENQTPKLPVSSTSLKKVQKDLRKRRRNDTYELTDLPSDFIETAYMKTIVKMKRVQCLHERVLQERNLFFISEYNGHSLNP